MTPLHLRPDGRWECFSSKNGSVNVGYCLTPDMVKMIAKGHPLEGLSWEQANATPWLSRLFWINQVSWERDRQLRIQHRAKFHSCGHTTEKEAIDCYQEFLKDFGMTEMETV